MISLINSRAHIKFVKSFWLILLFVIIARGSRSQTAQATFINPIGTYQLRINTHMEGEDAFGYYGDMRVKLIDHNKVVIDWNLNIGAPSYNNGVINDTLAYQNNKVVYKSEEDSTCRIDFIFYKNKVVVTEKTANYNSGCGFGHGVVGNGIYRKISGRVPEIDLPH